MVATASRAARTRGRAEETFTRADSRAPSAPSGARAGPHVRGRPRPPRSPRSPRHADPARAGTATMCSHWASGIEEDPRTRGDDAARWALYMSMAGRPPHARGRRTGGVFRALSRRKTPARAGTTPQFIGASRRAAEDPRTRGDDLRTGPLPLLAPGRPPHARGRRKRNGPRPSPSWKTPARAGTTRARRRSPAGPWEDPRTRGDDPAARTASPTARGRPPHARGRRGRRDHADQRARKTPARAGTTYSGSTRDTMLREDPRTRGDDVLAEYATTAVGGRPPHARGRRVRCRPRPPPRGKTPARAGTTPSPAA